MIIKIEIIPYILGNFENIDVRNIFINENIRKRQLVKGEMFLLRNLYK